MFIIPSNKLKELNYKLNTNIETIILQLQYH